MDALMLSRLQFAVTVMFYFILSIDPSYSLTIFNSSSSVYTLKIMTVVALVLVPVVIAYQVWIYRIFSHRVSADEILSDKEAY